MICGTNASAAHRHQCGSTTLDCCGSGNASRVERGHRAGRSTSYVLRCEVAFPPLDDASALALRVRLSTEASARDVLDEVGRALGATPFCRDRRFARAAADLPVFIRQSHAEHDFAALGERLLDGDVPDPWSP